MRLPLDAITSQEARAEMRDRKSIKRATCARTTRRTMCALTLLGLLALLGPVGCAAESDEELASSEPAALAASGGGVTVDVIATGSWQGAFNGAVRVHNDSFTAPITSFAVV